MQIRELFERDISRSINGVVKADQMDDALVWQELEEFVVTKELGRHLTSFYDAYLRTIDQKDDPAIAGRIGVWVSGFFGSGKSHTIKVLSHLLENRLVTRNGETRHALDFIRNTDIDPMLLGDMERAAKHPTDAILFNIDNKADSKAGRNAILRVFLKVLDERAGYSGDHAHIANMEYQLDEEGNLQTFHNAYKMVAGSDWEDHRDAYQFHIAEITSALAGVTNQDESQLESWLDTAEETFELTVERLCQRVKSHLDRQGPDHRLLFLVDEVGQFIGGDTHLMLNLQTIAEGLGTECGGRAWIVVTSQEDIDRVLGDASQARSYDFSKIQGRFNTRLSLSSTNADEVIQRRLLTKREIVVPPLEELHESKRDILANQTTFRGGGKSLTRRFDGGDFVASYPFVPYQFQLVQRVFEEIRKVGATGRHLAQGERSMLDAFQHALQSVGDLEVGELIPLYRMYPSIEGFLDSNVKRTIEQAVDRLGDFEINVLRLLFLIRYVDELPENVDNLVVLCADNIDVDTVALRSRIETALERLESETLIGRSGDRYHFLTDEEQDISRRIKETSLDPAVETREVWRIIFDEVLGDARKHRTEATHRDIHLHRVCDSHVHGSAVENGLDVSVITPFHVDYDAYQEPRCVLESAGTAIVKLREGSEFQSFRRELQTYLKTDAYIRGYDVAAADESVQRVIRAHLDDNNTRRTQLAELMRDLLLDASFYVHSQTFLPKRATAKDAVSEALDYLVNNTFSKMGYLEKLHDDPEREVQSLLRSDDLQKDLIHGTIATPNQRALDEVREYVRTAHHANHKVTVYSLVEERFGGRPYAWPEWETLLLLTHLVIRGEVELLKDGGPLPHDQIYAAINKTNPRRAVTVRMKPVTAPEDLEAARALAREVFNSMGLEDEGALTAVLREGIDDWRADLGRFRALAATGDYPGLQDIDATLDLIKPFTSYTDSGRMIQEAAKLREELTDARDDVLDLREFYRESGQKAVWERLRKAQREFSPNRTQLIADADAAKALAEIDSILDADHPYAMLANADRYIRTVKTVNDALVQEAREETTALVDKQIAYVVGKADDLTSHAEYPTISGSLTGLRDLVLRENSLGGLRLIADDAAQKASKAVEKLDGLRNPSPAGTPAAKVTRQVRATQLAPVLIEDMAQADDFIAKLRRQIADAIENDERVQIT